MIDSAVPSRPERQAPATPENGLYVACARAQNNAPPGDLARVQTAFAR